jgi:hypothetical protein
MQEHVRIAQRDLTQASTLLDQHTVSGVPALLLGVVDASIKSAKLRLELVEIALRDNGPSASDLPESRKKPRT